MGHGMDEFTDGAHFVLETSMEDLIHGTTVRCQPRRPSDLYGAIGGKALLHAPRHLIGKGYFGHAEIDNYDRDPEGRGMFVSLDQIVLFAESVSTLENGKPREDAPLDAAGRAAFSFYSRGLRPISLVRFEAILAAGGEGARHRHSTFDEDGPAQSAGLADGAAEVVRYEQVKRRVRAQMRAELMQYHGAFCCMSGASFNVPGGPSLLQVSHYWPLGHNGPDTLTNAGLMSPIIHPIYENGLATVRSDRSLRFAPDIPPGFRAEFRGRTHLSVSGNLRIDPTEENLAYHREEIFMRRLRRLGLMLKD